MASSGYRGASEVQVTLSVLDRLIDRDPRNIYAEGGATPPVEETGGRQRKEPTSRARSVRELKAAVRRDLEWLLNSRRIAAPPDEGLTELNRSVYTFGLPDFTTFTISTRDQQRMLRALQQAIKLFEPRLINVNLIPLETTGSSTRTLRFRIEALLHMDPAPEHVSFDTMLDLTSSHYQVQGEGNAG